MASNWAQTLLDAGLAYTGASIAAYVTSKAGYITNELDGKALGLCRLWVVPLDTSMSYSATETPVEVIGVNFPYGFDVGPD